MVSDLDSLQPLLYFFANDAIFILAMYLLFLMMTNRSSFSLIPLAFLFLSMIIFHFPSSYAALSFAFVSCIHRFKPSLTPYAASLATLIISSRVVSGLHDPIDVTLGALYGLFVVGTFHLIQSRFLLKKGRRKNRGRS